MTVTLIWAGLLRSQVEYLRGSCGSSAGASERAALGCGDSGWEWTPPS